WREAAAVLGDGALGLAGQAIAIAVRVSEEYQGQGREPGGDAERRHGDRLAIARLARRRVIVVGVPAIARRTAPLAARRQGLGERRGSDGRAQIVLVIGRRQQRFFAG